MMNKRLIALQALFALSGFCGLIYESIWSHYLKLFVGHAAYAQSLVLAVFMGGMGLGAWLVSRFTARIPNLLWGYALVELVIGATALAFHPLFGHIVGWAYESLLPGTCAPEGFCASQWVLATAMILPQSMLLGTTFPLMTGGILRLAPQTPGRQLALLYFLNSIGAVVGVLASGFVLIPWVGLPGALLTAGLGNVLLALAVYFLGKPPCAGAAATSPASAASAAPAAAAAANATPTSVATGVRPAEPALSDAPAERAFTRTLLWVSMLTGLSSFIYEIAWIRMLSMVLSSATHSFEIMLASFILGLALGGWWIRTRIERIGPRTLTVLAVVQMAMGVLALATVPLYNHTFDAMAWLMSGLARSEEGFVLYTLALTAVALAVMLPATFCAGMTLPLITSHLYRHGSGERALGQTYAANTLGAIAGVLLTVHLLMPGLGLKNTMAVGAAIDIVLGLVLLARRYRLEPVLRPGLRVLAAASVAAVCATPVLVRFDPLRMGSGVYRGGLSSLEAGTEILFARDGKTATVQIARFASGVVSVSTNGKSDGGIQMQAGRPATRDEATMVLTGALPLAYRPRAEEVAVIGFGTGLSSATLLGSPHLKRLDTIEIERAIVEGARHLRPANEAAYSDPRHHIVIDDAKAFFSRGQRRYDVIVSEPSNPWISGIASLFTEEFYARVKTHLKPDGLLVQWIHVYEISPELVASVFGALAQSFPAYSVYMASPGDMIIVAGADGQLPARSKAVFDMPAVKAALARVGIASEQHLAMQFVSNHRTLGPVMTSYGVPANADFFPLVDVGGLQARYLRADASPLTMLHMTEVPSLRAFDGVARFAAPAGADAERWAPTAVSPREGPYVHASLLAAAVMEGRAPPSDASYAPDLALVAGVRNRLFACHVPQVAQAPWDTVVRFAADTLPYLDEARAVALWRAVRDSPCARGRSADEARWLEMFERVARGRWVEASELAIDLLAGPVAHAPHARIVLTQVATTGLIVKGRRLDALRVLGSQAEQLPAGERKEAWVRLLWYQALSPALAAPAPAGPASAAR
ncbi:MAG: hypothetical protein JNL30_11995 [Rubrivivax sp.]|nr:hypothetical protein [Rubrivivax sp.]